MPGRPPWPRASLEPTIRCSAPSQTVEPRRAGSKWDRRRPRPSSPCGPPTVLTRHSKTSSTPRARGPVWTTARSSVRGPPYRVSGRKSARDLNEVKRLGGWRRRDHAERTHCGGDRDRPVLGRELAAAMESDHQERRRRPAAPATTSRPCCAATPASPKRRKRTGSRASSSDSTSARPSKQASNTAWRSATLPSTGSCGRSTGHCHTD